MNNSYWIHIKFHVYNSPGCNIPEFYFSGYNIPKTKLVYSPWCLVLICLISIACYSHIPDFFACAAGFNLLPPTCRLCVYKYVHKCIYTYGNCFTCYVSPPTCRFMCVSKRINTYENRYSNSYTCDFVSEIVYVCVCCSSVRVCLYVCIYACMYVYKYIHIHTHI